MIFNDDKLIIKLKTIPNAPTIKIFYFIAHNQPKDGIRGFQTTKQQLSYDLNLKMPTIFNSLRWLKSEMLIQELKLVDCSDFMVNPLFVMNNSDQDERIKEWNRRCNLDSAREVRLRKERRRRELKKQSHNQNS